MKWNGNGQKLLCSIFNSIAIQLQLEEIYRKYYCIFVCVDVPVYCVCPIGIFNIIGIFFFKLFSSISLSLVLCFLFWFFFCCFVRCCDRKMYKCAMHGVSLQHRSRCALPLSMCAVVGCAISGGIAIHQGIRQTVLLMPHTILMGLLHAVEMNSTINDVPPLHHRRTDTHTLVHTRENIATQ